LERSKIYISSLPKLVAKTVMTLTGNQEIISGKLDS